jgi:pilus assembly protein CpaC
LLLPFLAAAGLLMPALAPAQSLAPGQPQQAQPQPQRPTATPGIAPGGTVLQGGAPLALSAGSGRVVQTSRPVASVFAADPRVAEVRPASPTSLFVFGVAPGRTTVAALDSDGTVVAQHEVTVRPTAFTAPEAQSVLSRVMPSRNARIEMRPGGLALLGEVNTPAEAEQAVAIARGHLAEGQTLDNRLVVLGQVQVNLRVRIAEVSREVARAIGIDWQNIGNVGRFSLNLTTQNLLTSAINSPSRLAAAYSGTPDVNALIDLLARDRLIRLLAEPNLTAMSGETASFLAGGESPIPVGLRDGNITIQFKEYGVGLAFVPTVLAPNRISLRVRPEVSELTEQGAVRLSSGNASIQIPALTVRRAETTVELGSGQSFAIAGLLTDASTSTGRALPGIGELPIIGQLFRSDSFQRNETELVIIITPYIVRGTTDPNALRAPTDRQLQADDIDRGLLGRQLGSPRGGPPRLPGMAGFSMP